MITMLVANFTMRRILINKGRSTDILFWEVFTRMGIDIARLQLAPMPFKSFSEETVQLVKTTMLFILVGTAPCIASAMVDFLVTRAPSSYNAMIG